MRLLLTIIIATLFSFVGEAQTKKAFIVGVGEYDELTDLKKTIGDANGYSEVFSAQGFEVEELVGKPNQADFIVAFDAFVRSVGPKDEVVFVFSGHGWSDGSENYLALSDAPRSVPETLLAARSIPLKRMVMAQLRGRNPKLTFAIIDACRDEKYDPLTRTSSYGEKGIARISANEGELILYSSGAGQTSLDRLSNDDVSPYSVFTRILLPKLSATNRPLATIADETRSEVQRLAGTVDHRQRPEMMLGISLGYCLSGDCQNSQWKRVGPSAEQRRNAQMQELLRSMQFAPQRTDGVWDASSVIALQAYQRLRNIHRVTGQPTDAMLTNLLSAKSAGFSNVSCLELPTTETYYEQECKDVPTKKTETVSQPVSTYNVCETPFSSSTQYDAAKIKCSGTSGVEALIPFCDGKLTASESIWDRNRICSCSGTTCRCLIEGTCEIEKLSTVYEEKCERVARSRAGVPRQKCGCQAQESCLQ